MTSVLVDDGGKQNAQGLTECYEEVLRGTKHCMWCYLTQGLLAIVQEKGKKIIKNVDSINPEFAVEGSNSRTLAELRGTNIALDLSGWSVGMANMLA